MIDEKYVSEIVAKVVKNIDIKGNCSCKRQKGVFDSMEEALEAVSKARERVNALLASHVLYPELDLDFLKKEHK